MQPSERTRRLVRLAQLRGDKAAEAIVDKSKRVVWKDADERYPIYVGLRWQQERAA